MRLSAVTAGIGIFATLALALGSGCRTKPVARDPGYVFYPPPPNKLRIQYLTSFSGEEDLKGKASKFERFVFGEGGLTGDQLHKPYGIAVRGGVVYICDSGAGNVVRFDFRKKTFTRFGTRGMGKLLMPINIAVDERGAKYVIDSKRRQVVIFDANDRFAMAIDLPEKGRPADIDVYGDELYVLDNDKTPQVVVMNRHSGKVLRKFGKWGKKDDEMRYPTSLSIGPKGFLYLCDMLNFRIKKMTREGKVLWVKGQAGRAIGSFVRPKGLRVAPDGVIYVCDTAMSIYQMFNSDGRILMHFGQAGLEPGTMYLPTTLAIDTTSLADFQKYVHKDFAVKYLLFTVNQLGPYKINVFAFGEFPKGYVLKTGTYKSPPKSNMKDGVKGGPKEMEEGTDPGSEGK